MRNVKNSRSCIRCKIHTFTIHTFSMFKRESEQKFTLNSHSQSTFCVKMKRFPHEKRTPEKTGALSFSLLKFQPI